MTTYDKLIADLRNIFDAFNNDHYDHIGSDFVGNRRECLYGLYKEADDRVKDMEFAVGHLFDALQDVIPILLEVEPNSERTLAALKAINLARHGTDFCTKEQRPLCVKFNDAIHAVEQYRGRGELAEVGFNEHPLLSDKLTWAYTTDVDFINIPKKPTRK